MKLFKTLEGILIEHEGHRFLHQADWDTFINDPSLFDTLSTLGTLPSAPALSASDYLAPLQSQEVWASGVTYMRSREARMDEAKDAGGGDFYDRVYSAERPELFFKSQPYRVAGPGEKVRIRKDSHWDVPEPELVLMINAEGTIIGYTVGNDMSSRSIEGENPLYLPQAKCYDQAAAIGPCIFISPEPFPREAHISITILRKGLEAFAGSIQVNQIKRDFEELVEYLYREMSFPYGCLLMTGTGIVPPNDFTLQSGDEIRISIEHIGTLVNYVA